MDMDGQGVLHRRVYYDTYYYPYHDPYEMNTVPRACGDFPYHAPLNLEELESPCLPDLKNFAVTHSGCFQVSCTLDHIPRYCTWDISMIPDVAESEGIELDGDDFDVTFNCNIPQFLPVAAALQLFYENSLFLPDPTRAHRLLWKISVSRKALVRLLVEYARVKRDCEIYVEIDGAIVAHSGQRNRLLDWQGYRGSMYDEAEDVLRVHETWCELELLRIKEALTTGMLACQRDDFAHFPATVDYTWRMRYAPQQEVEPWDLARARKAISMDSDDEDELK